MQPLISIEKIEEELSLQESQRKALIIKVYLNVPSGLILTLESLALRKSENEYFISRPEINVKSEDYSKLSNRRLAPGTNLITLIYDCLSYPSSIYSIKPSDGPYSVEFEVKAHRDKRRIFLSDPVVFRQEYFTKPYSAQEFLPSCQDDFRGRDRQ